MKSDYYTCKREKMIDCDICDKENCVEPGVDVSFWDDGGHPYIFLKCHRCGSEFADSRVMKINSKITREADSNKRWQMFLEEILNVVDI